MNHEFSCLLHNNLRGTGMLFEIETLRLLYFKLYFDIKKVFLQLPQELVIYFYSTTTTK